MMQRLCWDAALFLTLTTFLAPPSAVGQEPARKPNDVHMYTWPQWRGPTRDGRTPPGVRWPTRLDDASLTPVWRVPLGPSYSGPIVGPQLVYTTETRDKKFEVVQAFDRSTGQKVWEAQWEGAMQVPFFAKSNGDWIRSTPALDGQSLYVAGMRDVLVCLDAATGNKRWQVDFVAQTGSSPPDFGFVCSPLVDEQFVYVQAGGAFYKLNKSDGSVVWKTLADGGGMWGSAFSSPLFADIAGYALILVQTREKLAAVDRQSGTVLWEQKIPAFRGMNILTPTVVGDSVFTSAYGALSYLFEIRAGDAAALTVTESWQNPARGYMSSPVVIDGHLYLHLQNQRFTCIDLASGKTKWTTKGFGKYWSMVTNGEMILALDERGELLLIRANPEKFELIDSRKISEEPAWAHLAVCGEALFIRELNALSALRWTRREDTPEQTR